MYKNDLAINDLQWLIYHKTKPNFWGEQMLEVFTTSFLSVWNQIIWRFDFILFDLMAYQLLLVI